jgi:hypothetical protein
MQIQVGLFRLPDGTEQLATVFKSTTLGAPLVFTKRSELSDRLLHGQWELGPVEWQAGALHGRPYEFVSQISVAN